MQGIRCSSKFKDRSNLSIVLGLISRSIRQLGSSTWTWTGWNLSRIETCEERVRFILVVPSSSAYVAEDTSLLSRGTIERNWVSKGLEKRASCMHTGLTSSSIRAEQRWGRYETSYRADGWNVIYFPILLKIVHSPPVDADKFRICTVGSVRSDSRRYWRKDLQRWKLRNVAN